MPLFGVGALLRANPNVAREAPVSGALGTGLVGLASFLRSDRFDLSTLRGRGGFFSDLILGGAVVGGVHLFWRTSMNTNPRGSGRKKKAPGENAAGGHGFT